VVLSRAVDVPHSRGGVAVKLRWGAAGVGAVGRFHVHELWHSQDVPDAWRTCYAVLCIEFMFYSSKTGEKKPEKKKTEKRVSNKQTST
jgi:hypothetical protein